SCSMSHAPTDLSTLSLHDALPICSFWPWTHKDDRERLKTLPFKSQSGPEPPSRPPGLRTGLLILTAVSVFVLGATSPPARTPPRSEEHTSELQSLRHLVCRLLLEK